MAKSRIGADLYSLPAIRYSPLTASECPAPSSARPVSSLGNLRAQTPEGPQEGVPGRFHWLASDLAPPFTLALLGAGYQKLVSIDGIAGTSWACDARVADCLARGGTFHWFVSAVRDGAVCRSALASFEIR